VHDAGGIDEEKLEFVIDLKTVKRGRISEYAEKYRCDYHAGKKPWGVPCDLAYPCATQNEIEKTDAELLVRNGCTAVAEGANMPTSIEAIEVLQNAKVLYAPGKASNAGGVAVSGLEMTQNSIRMAWSAEELEGRLKSIMKNIHNQCTTYGDSNGYMDYVKGANIAGFIKVADAMLAYGVI
ncbi:glutamate dehydrogenase, partial [bacterium]|nr:glutamate dehydrogenase [bacterium]